MAGAVSGWVGAYFARGVAKTEAKAEADGPGEDEEKGTTAREEAWLRRLDDWLSSHGLRPIAKRAALGYIQKMATGGETFARVRPWLLNQIGRSRKLPNGMSEWQKGCPSLVPGLRSHAFWDVLELPWVHTLEDNFDVIRTELLALRGHNAFQPYRAPASEGAEKAEDGVGTVSHDSGDWNVYYLYLHNLDFPENRDRCPETCRVIESISGQYSHAMFSALAPGTHVTKHNGPTNKKLRCHLPLVVPEGRCRLRVGEEARQVELGKCLVFDDSFEHEAWNDDPTATRIVLILDVWHPDLRPEEVKFLDFLQKSALRTEKEIVTRRDENNEEEVFDNFFTVIQAAKRLTKDDGIIFQGH